MHTKALAGVCRSVNEDFRGDDGAKRRENLNEIVVVKFLWQMVDEEIGTIWS